MLKIMKTGNSKQSEKLNASAGLSESLVSTLANVAKQLQSISADMGALIEEQVNNPEYVEGDDVAADRLLDWTADVFAISQDIEFYINPKPDKK